MSEPEIESDFEPAPRWSEATLKERIAELEAEVKRLRDLLIEWRETGFFEDHELLRVWMKEFGGRVDAATESKS